MIETGLCAGFETDGPYRYQNLFDMGYEQVSSGRNIQEEDVEYTRISGKMQDPYEFDTAPLLTSCHGFGHHAKVFQNEFHIFVAFQTGSDTYRGIVQDAQFTELDMYDGTKALVGSSVPNAQLLSCARASVQHAMDKLQTKPTLYAVGYSLGGQSAILYSQMSESRFVWKGEPITVSHVLAYGAPPVWKHSDQSLPHSAKVTRFGHEDDITGYDWSTVTHRQTKTQPKVLPGGVPQPPNEPRSSFLHHKEDEYVEITTHEGNKVMPVSDWHPKYGVGESPPWVHGVGTCFQSGCTAEERTKEYTKTVLEFTKTHVFGYVNALFKFHTEADQKTGESEVVHECGDDFFNLDLITT